MNEQLLNSSVADVLSSRKKLKKTLWGAGRILVRPRLNPPVSEKSPSKECDYGSIFNSLLMILRFSWTLAPFNNYRVVQSERLDQLVLVYSRSFVALIGSNLIKPAKNACYI